MRSGQLRYLSHRYIYIEIAPSLYFLREAEYALLTGVCQHLLDDLVGVFLVDMGEERVELGGLLAVELLQELHEGVLALVEVAVVVAGIVVAINRILGVEGKDGVLALLVGELLSGAERERELLLGLLREDPADVELALELDVDLLELCDAHLKELVLALELVALASHFEERVDILLGLGLARALLLLDLDLVDEGVHFEDVVEVLE